MAQEIIPTLQDIDPDKAHEVTAQVLVHTCRTFAQYINIDNEVIFDGSSKPRDFEL